MNCPQKTGVRIIACGRFNSCDDIAERKPAALRSFAEIGIAAVDLAIEFPSATVVVASFDSQQCDSSYWNDSADYLRRTIYRAANSSAWQFDKATAGPWVMTAFSARWDNDGAVVELPVFQIHT